MSYLRSSAGRVSYHISTASRVLLMFVCSVAVQAFGLLADTVEFAASDFPVRENAGQVDVLLKRTGDLSQEVTVHFQLVSDSAVAPHDYEDFSGPLTFWPDDASLLLPLPIVNDDVSEPDERFIIKLTNPTSGTVIGAQGSATITILNDDGSAENRSGKLAFGSSTYTVAESAGVLSIEVQRSGGTSGTVTAEMVTVSGTASAGSDFTVISRLVTFKDAQASQTVDIPISNDGLAEGSEIFEIQLRNPTGGAVFATPSKSVVTITDDDQEDVLARQGSLRVFGTANIFAAGQPEFILDGTTPPSARFWPGPGKILRFSKLTGAVTIDRTTTGLYFGGDGSPLAALDVQSGAGIAGLVNHKTAVLVGVFLGPNPPDASAPDRLDYTTFDPNTPVLSPEIAQTFVVGDGRTADGNYQKFIIPENATRLFLGFADSKGDGACTCGLPGDYENNGGSVSATFDILGTPPPPLPKIDGFSYSTSAPIRTGVPWKFTATYSAEVSDLRLRVQSTLKPENAISWTDLPGLSRMTHLDSTWSLDTLDVPTGPRYFRAIASSPEFSDTTSDVIGPLNVEEGISAFGGFTYQTTLPTRSGSDWTFDIIQKSIFPDLRLRLQSTTTPEKELSWTDLPDSSRMFNLDGQWSLTTKSVPVGKRYFRVVASATGFGDRRSQVLGPIDVGQPLPVVTKVYETGTSTLGQIPQQSSLVVLKAAPGSQVSVTTDPGVTEQTTPALAVTGENGGKVIVTIPPQVTLNTPGLSVDGSATLITAGLINGGLAIGGGGLLSTDEVSAAGRDSEFLEALQNAGLLDKDGNLISDDGSSLISDDGSSLISDDGSSLISDDGSSLISDDGSSFFPSNARSASMLMSSDSSGNLFLAASSTSSTGIMKVTGDYLQGDNGALGIVISGKGVLATGKQEFDQLVVGGTAQLSGVIGCHLVNPADPKSTTGRFEPAAGTTFDIIVANRILSRNLVVRGPIWGNGVRFTWGIVQRPDGKQALRLFAIEVPPPLVSQKVGNALQLAWPSNYSGYTLESASELDEETWTPIPASGNRVELGFDDTVRFFRLKKQ